MAHPSDDKRLDVTQLSSFFLVCIGVQIAWNGIKALLESLTLHFG
jgi:multiple antibiotic resistance protein